MPAETSSVSRKKKKTDAFDPYFLQCEYNTSLQFSILRLKVQTKRKAEIEIILKTEGNGYLKYSFGAIDR